MLVIGKTQIEEDQLMEAAKEAAAYFRENSEYTDIHAVFPIQNINLLKEKKLMAILVPEQFGGQGANIKTIVNIGKILASSCLSTGMIWAMHSQQVACLVNHYENAMKADILRDIADKQAYIVSVTSEYKKEANLLTAAAPLQWGEDYIDFERKAPNVTGGSYGDYYLITMKRDENTSNSKVALLLANREEIELVTGDNWKTMGARGTQSHSIEIKGRVHQNYVIDPKQGFDEVALRTMVPFGHIIWAACWLGAAQSVFTQVLDLFRNPETRKKFNLNSDLLMDRIARVRLNIDMVDVYLHEVVEQYQGLIDQNRPLADYQATRFKIHINNLKLLSSEKLYEAADQLMQIAGLGFGFTKNKYVHIERTLRDLRSASLMFNNDSISVMNGKFSLLDKKLLGI